MLSVIDPKELKPKGKFKNIKKKYQDILFQY